MGYTLDAFGRVITRTQGSSTTSFTYAGISEALATSTTGATTTSYAHTPGGPLGERSGTSAPVLYLRDLHDDVVGTVDATATAPLSRAYYSPWGEPTWEDGTSALGFQGQVTDPGTGFVAMTTRNYVPSLGRFASRDVVFGGLRHPLSLNQWAYAEGDPLTNTDPLGLAIVKDADPDDGCVGTCASDGIAPDEHGGNPPTSSVGTGTGDEPPLGPIGAYLTSTEGTDTFTPVPIANCLTGLAAPSPGEDHDGGGLGQDLQTTCLTNTSGWFSSTTQGSTSTCLQTPTFGVGLGGTTQLTTGLGCGSSRVEEAHVGPPILLPEEEPDPQRARQNIAELASGPWGNAGRATSQICRSSVCRWILKATVLFLTGSFFAYRECHAGPGTQKTVWCP